MYALVRAPDLFMMVKRKISARVMWSATANFVPFFSRKASSLSATNLHKPPSLKSAPRASSIFSLSSIAKVLAMADITSMTTSTTLGVCYVLYVLCVR